MAKQSVGVDLAVPAGVVLNQIPGYDRKYVAGSDGHIYCYSDARVNAKKPKPFRVAGKMLLNSGFTTTSHCLRAYVLCGYPGDTIIRADMRMEQTDEAGFLPMAMLYRDEKGCRDPEWQKWARQYTRPAITCSSSFNRHHD